MKNIIVVQIKTMEQKNGLIGSTTTIHVIGEIVALGGVLYYVSNQTSQLNAKIVSLEQKVLELTTILRNLVPNAFPPIQENIQGDLKMPPKTLNLKTREQGKWEFLKPSNNLNEEINDSECVGGICTLPLSKNASRENEEKNVTFNGSVEQLKYGNSILKKSTKMMIGSPSMRPLVPESVGIDEEDAESFSSRKDVEMSEIEINKLVSKAIRPAAKRK